MLAGFLDAITEGDSIVPQRMADRLRVPLNRLSALACVSRYAMTSRAESAAVQAKLGEIAQIITRASEVASDERKAIFWFKYQPIVGFGLTAEQLVQQGHSEAVLWTLESMEQGVYA